MLIVAVFVVAKLAIIHLGPLIAAASASGSEAPILVTVLLALVGSGGIGYFLARRSAQASRLAQDAVSATDVFQRSLDEERHRRKDLTTQLNVAQDQLKHALAMHERDAHRIAELEGKVTELQTALAEARLQHLAPNDRRP